MARLQVSCIGRGKKGTPHERLASIGGLSYGAHWRHTIGEAIAAIENGVNTYYVDNNKVTADLVVTTNFAWKYLSAVDQTTSTDLLLTLPDCSS